MSAQMIEVLVLAGIAFLIISKLISILGVTDEDDPARRASGSFFGEPKGMKDVTGETEAVKKNNIVSISKRLKKLDEEADDMLKAVMEKFPDFELDKFLSGAKGAFEMIIEAMHNKDTKTLQELVDKRFIRQIEEMADSYGKFKSGALKASCVDSYSFGHGVYVKVLFDGKNITSNTKHLKEAWVFTKNVAQTGPEWYLSNIEKLS